LAGAHDPIRIPGIQFQLFNKLPGVEEDHQPVIAQFSKVSAHLMLCKANVY
jgi:hypothetical protein